MHEEVARIAELLPPETQAVDTNFDKDTAEEVMLQRVNGIRVIAAKATSARALKPPSRAPSVPECPPDRGGNSGTRFAVDNLEVGQELSG